MGVVYRAYHAQLERTGAVKVMQALAPDKDAIARFRHEAQAIAQMRHPNILNVYDFGEYQGTPYMIVEYVPGGSLAGRLSEGGLDSAASVRYLRGVAAGLDYAHSKGVVHRDVKPANVLLTRDDTPVLADFGLAKLLQGSSLKSMTGVTTGTPAYMAPEQVMGSQVGPAADRYALATIAYEMLAGAIPFQGEGLLELLYAQVHRQPRPPSALNPALGPHIDAVILRGLSKNPTSRWESCGLFVEALEAAIADPGQAAASRTMVLWPSSPSTPAAAPPAAFSSPPPPALASRPAPALASRPGAAVASQPAPAVSSTPPVAARAVPARPISFPPPSSPPPGPPASAPPPVPPPLIPTPGIPSSTSAVAHPAVPARPKRRSRRSLLTMLAGLVVLVLVALALLGFVASRQPALLSLSVSTVSPGGRVVVSISRMPANQSGEVQLHSRLYVFPFQAGGNGQAQVDMTIPYDVGVGDHEVDVCWNGACHGHAVLHVTTLYVLPTARPLETPSAYPTPSATPSPSAVRTPTPAVASLALSTGPFERTVPFTVYGLHFPSKQTVTVSLVQGASDHYLTTTTTTGQGTFLAQVTLPSSTSLGLAAVRACAGSVCAYATFTVSG